MDKNDFWNCVRGLDEASAENMAAFLKAEAALRMHIHGQAMPEEYYPGTIYNDAWLESEYEVEQAYTCPDGDHAYEDESYGNAESGCIHLCCNRCGHVYHNTLY